MKYDTSSDTHNREGARNKRILVDDDDDDAMET